MRGRALLVRIGRGSVRAELNRSGTIVWAAESSYDTEADLLSVLSSLGAEPGLVGRTQRARIELGHPLVQLRTLTELPPVRQSALRALVAHQAGRFFRKNGKPLVTSATWGPRSRGAPKIAMAAAVEEPLLDAIVQGVREAGFELVAITPAESSLQLLPGKERIARAGAARRRIRHLAATAAALWGLVGLLAVHRFARESDQVEQALAALGPAAAAARAVKQQYDTAESMIAAIETARSHRGAVSIQTARVLLALPDSSYLMSLHVNDQAAGELTGAARRPLDVVAALERGSAVALPRLIGSTSRPPVDGRDYERLTVRFGAERGR